MGRRLKVLVLCVLALIWSGCPNPLLDKVRNTVAEKNLVPQINIKTAAGAIPIGGTFDFATISINTSKDVTFIIENLGTGALSLTDNPKVSISGTDAALFKVQADPSTPIPAGTTASFVIRFLPTASGAKTATVTIPNNDSSKGNYSFSITGAGSVQAAMRLLQGPTDIPPTTGQYGFPQTAVGHTSSPDITFAIKNVGTAVLNLTGTPQVSPATGDFTVVLQPSTPVSNPSGITYFTMHFNPTSEGAKSVTLSIPNDDPDRVGFTFVVKGQASTVMLPKTGQTTSFGTDDDGQLQTGVSWPSSRFTTSTYTITDNLTGLMWTKSANFMASLYVGFDQDGTVDDGKVTWQHALDFVAKLNTDLYGTVSGWRLPNLNELRSLVNCGASGGLNVLLGSQGFLNLTNGLYWTSTTNANSATMAWTLKMDIGEAIPKPKNNVSNLYYAWPVRTASGTPTVRLPRTGQTAVSSAGDDGTLQMGAAWPATRFTNNGDGTMTDHLTGLIWERAPSATGHIWTDALAYAAGLTLGGSSDWRLPNLNELSSLLNPGEIDSIAYLIGQGFSIDTGAFYYWTSSTDAMATDNGWSVHLGSGGISAIGNAKGTYSYRVIAVRSPP